MSKELLNEIKRNRELMSVNEGVGQDVLDYIKNYLKDTKLYKMISKSVDDVMPDDDETTDTDTEIDDEKFKEIASKLNISSDYTGKAKEMVNRTISEMDRVGIDNPYAQVGILSVIGKESGFEAIKEKGYCNTSDSRIVEVFGPRGTKCKSSKCDNEKFFECVYGKDSGVRLGNTEPGDGWKYVGRGLNGITGRGNYRKYGQLIGVDLENNPELLEDPKVSVKAAIAFLLKGKKPENLPNFKSEEEAIKYFADVNAGSKSETGRKLAKKVAPRFRIDI